MLETLTVEKLILLLLVIHVVALYVMLWTAFTYDKGGSQKRKAGMKTEFLERDDSNEQKSHA